MKTFERSAGADIILDLSRLLSRIKHATPTGVDRCELAYARGLLLAVPQRLQFVAWHPFGFYGELDKRAVLQFLDATEMRWQERGFRSNHERRRFALESLTALWPKRSWRARTTRRVFVQASPSNLTRPDRIAYALKREQARFVCLVHDLIPLEFPEYARPDGAAEHARRIQTIATFARGILGNSQATLHALQPYLDLLDHHPITAVAHLGTKSRTDFNALARSPAAIPERPYFVCIGTIEPRKNHLLLLHLWRRMSEREGTTNIPKLLIIGRRGWENEQIVDMLERCVALRGCVEEHNQLADRDVEHLLQHARGLLMPSFAEGYGMPVAEALALGVPVVCSDLPALREAGQDSARFLDPLDGPAWLAAIKDLSDKPQRNPVVLQGWGSHMNILLDVVSRVQHL